MPNHPLPSAKAGRRVASAQRLRFAPLDRHQGDSVAARSGNAFAVGRQRPASQAESFGGYATRLPSVQIHEVDTRTLTRFVTGKYNTFAVGQELTKAGDHVAGRNRPLLPHAGGEQYEVRRLEVLPQYQSPLAIGRKSTRASLAQTHGRITIGLA